MKMRNHTWLWRLVGIAVMVVIAARIDLRSLRHALSQADVKLVLVSALLFGLHLGVKAVRWNRILAASGIRLTQRQTLLGFSAGALLGAVTPGRVGDFCRAVYVRRRDATATWGAALATIVLDRVIDLGVLVLVSLVGLVWIGLPGIYRVMGEMLIVFMLVVGFVVSLAVWRRLFRADWGLRVREFLRARLGTEVSDFYRVIRVMRGPLALTVVGWTACAYAIFFLHFYLLARAMGSDLPSEVVVWGIAVASLAAAVPLSISGIGFRDFALIAVFMEWGQSPPVTLAISLTYLAVLYTLIPLMGIWPLMWGELGDAPWRLSARTEDGEMR